jgi:hypothetical protein
VSFGLGFQTVEIILFLIKQKMLNILKFIHIAADWIHECLTFFQRCHEQKWQRENGYTGYL